MTRPLALRLAAASFASLLLAGTAGAGIIDFETIPGGLPAEGLVISDQFRATEGVTFSLEGGGHPILAAIGSPMTAFGGGADNQHDLVFEESAALVGSFFLTDDGAVAAPPRPLLIHYDTPVDAASGIMIDVDGWGIEPNLIWEAFRIEARDADDVVLETLELIGSIDGDGQASSWSFERALADISSIRISYFGNKPTGIGLAFDYFSPSTPFPPVPEPGTLALVALGLGALVTRRR